MKSPVAEAIERAIANGVRISVYLDDFIGSHNDEEVLKTAYQDIHDTCVSAGLVPNPAKLVPPNAAITAFNCDLAHRTARLTEERIRKYQSRADRTAATDAAFEQYRLLVASENL
jgi:phosphatidylserine/phosphatidylglycerophosphate/cardiolipin synthase-like enzyme